MLTDSHCHLTAEQFDADRGDVIERASAVGVGRMVTIASNATDAVAASQLAESHEAVWATAGVHPHEVGDAADGDMSRVRGLCDGPRVVAVGETGLDYHYDNAPRSLQRRFLDQHGELAADSGLPLVIHSRSADEDLGSFLKGLPEDVTGVLHCFTGGPSLFDTAVERGWYFGYGGIATFKNFKAHDLLIAVPRNRLLLETDAPYLAPVPMRGRRNEPAFITHVADRIAEIRGVTRDALAAQTSANAARLFRLPSSVPEAH